MQKITVKPLAAKRLRQGTPLLVAEDLKNPEQLQLDSLAELVDASGQRLGTAYLSKQNKGIGWLLTKENRPIDHDFYVEKFVAARAARGAFFADLANDVTNAFRIFNGEGDGLGGLTVDYYAGYAVFSWYNHYIYSQKKAILKAFQTVFTTADILGATEKLRFENAEVESQLLYGQVPPTPLLVKENGVTFATYLDEGLMTGIFLDQKNVRAKLADGLAAGGTLLNMFSYTGAFSVAAAVGGSSQTTSVDLAKRSLDKTREQFSVNGIDPDSQKIYVMDVFKYFSYAKKKKLSYDTIVLDPPSFARNGKKTFAVSKNYGELVADAVDILANHGMLIASTNAANVSPKKFREIVEKALQSKAVSYQIVQEERLPSDFKVAPHFAEGDYLKVLFVSVRK